MDYIPENRPFWVSDEAGHEVVLEGLGDADGVEMADAEGGRGGDKHFVVDFGAVVFGAADVVVAFVAVDEDAEGAANAGLVLLHRDGFLYGHELTHTPFLFFLRDGVAQFLGRGSLFG